jgi:hypothetical protein
MASNNDCGLREYDLETFQLLNHFRFPWPVNVSYPHHLQETLICILWLNFFVSVPTFCMTAT